MTISISVTPEIYGRICELACDGDFKPGRLAGDLLGELVPTITSVRARLQITREKKLDAS